LKKQKRLREKENIKALDALECVLDTHIIEANRQLSSKWTIAVKIEATMALEDGRILIVDETRNLPARQIGRKQSKESAKKENSQE